MKGYKQATGFNVAEEKRRKDGALKIMTQLNGSNRLALILVREESRNHYGVTSLMPVFSFFMPSYSYEERVNTPGRGGIRVLS